MKLVPKLSAQESQPVDYGGWAGIPRSRSSATTEKNTVLSLLSEGTDVTTTQTGDCVSRIATGMVDTTLPILCILTQRGQGPSLQQVGLAAKPSGDEIPPKAQAHPPPPPTHTNDIMR